MVLLIILLSIVYNNAQFVYNTEQYLIQILLLELQYYNTEQYAYNIKQYFYLLYGIVNIAQYCTILNYIVVCIVTD